MLIDSHCHLYYEPYVNKIKETLDTCKKYNVRKLLSIGVDIETSKKNIELANLYKEIFCTIGIHPNEVINASESNLLELKKIFKNSNKILAIGEIGLDFFRNKNIIEQENFFHKQIKIALELNLPIVIHSREAEEYTIKILKDYQNENLKFVVHCFTGTKKFAENIIKLNGYISVGGILTFKKSEELRDICKDFPLEKILIETDSPYLSPDPLRGRVNCPSNVRFVAEKLASVKSLNIDEIEKETENNFNQFFCTQ